jgi:hypothetical protein
MRSTTMAMLLTMALLAGAGVAGAPAEAQPMTTVTLSELFPTRIVEVDVGTEVVFADPRFLGIEMVPDDGAPEATRIPLGFSAVFRAPGVYRFIATVVGVDRASTVPCQVVVRPRREEPGLFDFARARPGVTEAQFRLAQEECLHDPRIGGQPRLYVMCMQALGVQPVE